VKARIFGRLIYHKGIRILVAEIEIVKPRAFHLAAELRETLLQQLQIEILFPIVGFEPELIAIVR
jgi:hypothetical protein